MAVCWKSITVNAVISIILLCLKDTYLSNGEFPKLILTLIILPLQTVVVLQQAKKQAQNIIFKNVLIKQQYCYPSAPIIMSFEIEFSIADNSSHLIQGHKTVLFLFAPV